ncbi:glycosyltransferase family 2 protein [Virgibacillus ainsalahensis]
MKDITAILLHYSDKKALYKALNSLKEINTRLKSVLVFQEEKINLKMMHTFDWIDHIESITVEDKNPGKTLHTNLHKINSPYVLFLHHTDYLSPAIRIDTLQISHPRMILETLYHNQNIAIHHPLLVRTSFLKKQNFFSHVQLPFKEALFPAWLSNIRSPLKTFKKDLVKQAKKNSSANTLEKQKFVQKYQLKKIKTNHPSLTVFIANYNMEKYVETAVASCLLQNEQPEQVLIMDDGSTDGSDKKLQHWSDGRQVKLFNKENEGKARALNDLLPHVQTDFILELDADDWLDPDAISIVKKNLEGLPEDVAVLYGNLRKWKQLAGDVLFKRIAKGNIINGKAGLLSYRFPLGPRIYRTSSLKKIGGFPVIAFENGRLYEDISVLNLLLKNFRFQYHDFTVYNVREHKESITKTNLSNWNDFLKTLD